MDNQRPMFSAIIAAYNVEQYIARCIESVLQVDRDDLELIIVVGKETDLTNQICRSYCENDRIRLIRQDGTGLSNARNCGLKAANGTYVFFVDGDDSVCKDHLEMFLQDASELISGEVVDAILNDFYFTDINENVLIENKQVKVTDRKFVNYEYINQIVKKRGTFWNTWRFLFSKKYLEDSGLQFKENSVCEDLDFTIRLFYNTNHIWFCHMPYYNYCPIRSDSLMNTKTYKMVQDFLTVQHAMRSLCRENIAIFSAQMMHKLDELLILCLPDIYEVNRKERVLCAKAYQTFIRREINSTDILYRAILAVCKTKGIYVVSSFLYWLKRLRRKRRYG